MLCGIGVDIVDVPRMRRVLQRWGVRFQGKVFTEGEQRYAAGRQHADQILAARFAAKEAFAKATGEGWGIQFRWREVEVVNDDTGRPRLVLHGGTKERYGDRHLLLSLSHTEQQAIAIVTLE